MGGLTPPPLILLVTWISNIGFCVPGNQQINANMVNSDALKNSFFPRTIPTWNSLPSSVVSSKTIEEFKAQI